MKKCISCKTILPLNNFSGDISRSDGFFSKCKKCTREYSKNRRIKNGWIKKEPKGRKPNKDYQKKYMSKKRNEDPIFKFKTNTRSLLYNAFRRSCNGTYKKSKRTEEMLGCNMNEFIVYISSKFEKGMSFENYGKWHLDHIYPISKCKTIEDILKYNHHTNLQPLWAKDNILKGDKITQTL